MARKPKKADPAETPKKSGIDWGETLKIAAGVLAILGVGSIMGLIASLQKCFAPSKTEIYFVTAEAMEIHVNAVNEGVRSAYFRGAVLAFGDLPIESRSLELTEAGRKVTRDGLEAGKETAIALTAPGFRTKKSVDGKHLTRTDVAQLLDENDYRVVLIVQVEESNGQRRDRPIHLKSSAIREFILEGIPEEEEEP